MRRRISSRRGPTEWAVRGLLATFAAVIGYFPVTHSLAQVLGKSSVERAHALAPYDGRITARLAASFAGHKASAADRRRSNQLARLALRQDPTAVLAVSTLGLNAQLRGDTKGARRLFAYAEKLSRRDLQTQLWAIEDAVARNDVSGALKHYDIALRTEPQVSELLYPILASASADPEIRSAVVRTLADKPAWADSFINYIAGKGTDPRSTARLFLRLRRARVVIAESANSEMINGLISRGLKDEAWAYYASVRPGADRRMSRDPDFSSGNDAPSQLDWVVSKETSVSTSIQRGEQGGVFDFAVPPSIGGSLLQQVQMLPPGDYQLAGHSMGVDQVKTAQPYWTLRCPDGRELGRVVLPNSSEMNGKFAGRFSVPAGCSVQTLVLVARPSDAVTGLSGQIDRVQLLPVR